MTKSERIVKHTLHNGLQIIVKPIQDSPIVTVNVGIKVNCFNEGNKRGLRNLINELLIMQDKTEIKRADEITGVVLHDWVILKSLSINRFYPNLIKRFGRLLTSSSFNDYLIEYTKMSIASSMAKTDNPLEKLYQRFLSEIYAGFPYAYPVTGDLRTIQTLANQEILDFFKEFYTAQNIVIVVMGGISPQFAIDCISKSFANINSGHLNSIPSMEITLNNSRRIVEAPEQPLAWIILGCLFPGVTSEDRIAANMLYLILDDTVREVIRFKHNLAYLACVRYTDSNQMGNIAGLSCVDRKNVERVEGELFSVFKSFAEKTIDINKLQSYKQKWKGLFVWSTEGLTEQAQIMCNSIIYGSDSYIFEESLKAANDLTPTDLSRIAKKYFTRNYVSIIR